MRRPSKLNPERTRALLDALRAGCFVPTACRAAGISRSTLRRWLERGQSRAEDDAPYRTFRREYHKALAEVEAEAVQTIRRAGSEDVAGSWQASAWFLERRFPARWRKKTEAPVPPPPKPLEKLTDAELEEYTRLLDRQRFRAWK